MSFDCQIFVEFPSKPEHTKAKRALELRSHQFGTNWPKEIAEALNKVGKVLIRGHTREFSGLHYSTARLRAQRKQ
jgi:hypothetical protein